MSDIDAPIGAAPFPGSGRVEVHPGTGVVHRGTDALLVVPEVEGTTGRLTAELVQVCGIHPDPGGSRRIRRLAWMITEAEPGDIPGFVLAVAAGPAVRVMAYGEVSVAVQGAEEAASFRGTESVAWVERTTAASFDTLTVTGRADTAHAKAPAPHPVPELLDLQSGTVPGVGVTVRRAAAAPRVSPAPPEAREPVEATQQPAAPAPPEPAAADAAQGGRGAAARVLPRPVPRAPTVRTGEAETVLREAVGVRHVSLFPRGSRTERPRRPALPIGAPAQQADDEQTRQDVVQVSGVVCRCGQFNDPESDSCSSCGSPVDATGPQVWKPRPPLGILITDDGRVSPVTGDLVIGREPEQAPEVRAGKARPLTLQDAEHSTSRVHARIRLDGWKVLVSDGGSANGTFLSTSGAAGPWKGVPRDPGTRLAHGDRIRLGRRELLFDRYLEPL